MSDSISNRYNSLGVFLRNKFGTKVYKVSLNGGFSCPNLDGTKSRDGCIYCNPKSNRPEMCAGRNIAEQVAEGIEYMRKRHHASKFIAYFQHHSNTYAPQERLERHYNDAISHNDIVGLAISTRPDCITSETVDVLRRFNKRTFLWLELGLQSANDGTLQLINRRHTVEDFKRAVAVAHSNDILTCAHIILGLPGETRSDMMATIDLLAETGIGGVKIHNLHVLKDTKLADMYRTGNIRILSLEEYAGLVVDSLERLPKDVLVHRFNGHSPRNLTIAPKWSINKLATLNAVHRELSERDTFQGHYVR